jgi:hypothetical protein
MKMSEALDDIWKAIWKRWSTSNPVSRPSLDCEQVAKEHPEFEERVFKALTHENRFLVAHCLITLEAMKSPRLASLPKDLLEREERITLIYGSFAQHYTVGRLAREIGKNFEPSSGANGGQARRRSL